MSRWGVVLLASCGGAPEPPEPSRPDIVLVTLDTVRADRVGAYGYAAAETPALDALAERGLRFERAYSPYPYTIPAHASVMTGLYPPQHGVRDNGDKPLGPQFETLAEVLDGAGYATGASVAAFVTSRQWGFSRGFDVYSDEVPRAQDFWHASRRGADVVDDALAWEETVDEHTPRFLWVHLYDAHRPLEPVEPFATTHEGRPYDAEIAYVDAQVARLVERFEGRQTVFVVTSDHGESNGDHRERGHGMYVYDSTQRVPLVIAGPGVERGVSDQLVSLVDVMPTVLGLVGLAIPDGLAGRPVPSEDQRPVYLESWQLPNRFGFAPHLAIVQGNHKLIDLPEPELYALDTDPGELENLAEKQPSRVAELSAALKALAFSPPPKGHDAVSMETTEELLALGYLVGERPDLPLDALPDPKRHANLLVELQRTDLWHADDRAKAAASLKRIVKEDPDIAEVRVRLVTLLVEQGELQAAETLLAAGLERSDDQRLRSAMATVLLAQGRLSEAADLLLSQRAHREYSPRYRVRVVRALLAADRAPEAETLAREFLITYPDDIEVLGTLAVYLAGTGRTDEAEPLLERAAQADPPPIDVSFALGMRAAFLGEEELAVSLLLKEVEDHPFGWRARSALAARARDTEDWSAWTEHTRHLVRVKPEDVGLWREHAQALFNSEDVAGARIAVDRALSLDATDPDVVLLDANLMGREGRLEQGKARFEEAKTLHEARL